MHPEQERGDRFPSVPNAGEGFRAAGSGGVHPRREAGRKQHAQRTRYLRRNARIKPQGKFFLPDQADEDKQGSQQKPGSRNVVFISHACQQSQCHYASPLAETLFSRLSFFPVFPIFQQFPVQAQETEPEGGSPGIVGSAGEPVNRDAGPGRTGEEQEKRQSEEPHVRPGTGVHPAPGGQIEHHQREADLYKGVEQNEEPFARCRHSKGQVFPDSGVPAHVGGHAAFPDQAEGETVFHARQGVMVRV